MTSNVLRRIVFLTIVGIGAATQPASAVITDAPAPAKPSKIKVETFAGGLDHPWGMQFLPDGRLLVTERLGRMRLIAKDGRLSPPILEGLPEVAAVGQGGLLDVLLAPDFEKSHIIYFSYGEPRDEGKNGTSVARAKLVFDGDGGKLDDVKVIFRQEPPHTGNNHWGSRLVFDSGGNLFVTLGERFDLRDQAQNPANLLGKLVHITPDGKPAPDNPFLNQKGTRPEIWSIGHP